MLVGLIIPNYTANGLAIVSKSFVKNHVFISASSKNLTKSKEPYFISLLNPTIAKTFN